MDALVETGKMLATIAAIASIATLIVMATIKSKHLPEIKKELSDNIGAKFKTCKEDSNNRIQQVDGKAGSRVENLGRELDNYNTNMLTHVGYLKREIETIHTELGAINERMGNGEALAAQRHEALVAHLLNKSP